MIDTILLLASPQCPEGRLTETKDLLWINYKIYVIAVPGQNSIAVKRYYGTPGRYPGILTYYRLGSKIIRIDGNTPKTSLLRVSRGLRGGIGLKGGNLGGKIVPTNEKMTPLKGILYAGSYWRLFLDLLSRVFQKGGEGGHLFLGKTE